jgi:hypothetical protein
VRRGIGLGDHGIGLGNCGIGFGREARMGSMRPYNTENLRSEGGIVIGRSRAIGTGQADGAVDPPRPRTVTLDIISII